MLTPSRSLFLPVLLASMLLGGCATSTSSSDSSGPQVFTSAPPVDVTRIFVGPDYWANRLHDWRIAEGRIEMVTDDERNSMRALHLLTRRVGRDRVTCRWT